MILYAERLSVPAKEELELSIPEGSLCLDISSDPLLFVKFSTADLTFPSQWFDPKAGKATVQYRGLVGEISEVRRLILVNIDRTRNDYVFVAFHDVAPDGFRAGEALRLSKRR